MNVNDKIVCKKNYEFKDDEHSFFFYKDNTYTIAETDIWDDCIGYYVFTGIGNISDDYNGIWFWVYNDYTTENDEMLYDYFYTKAEARKLKIKSIRNE